MKLEILRLKQSPLDDPKQTEGVLYLRDDKGTLLFECVTLELPWKNNQNSISCVPDGKYKGRYRQASESPSQKIDHIHILDVPNRSYILVHAGNYHWHVEGCVLVGKSHVDINKDGLLDVTNSVATMKRLMSFIPKYEQIDVVVRWR